MLVASPVDAQEEEAVGQSLWTATPGAEAQSPRGCPSNEGAAAGCPAATAVPGPSQRGERPDQEGGRRSQGDLVGVASTYGPGYRGLTAVPVREWRGRDVRICYGTSARTVIGRDGYSVVAGPGRCLVRVANDYGPDQRVHPDRVVDLDVRDFERLCGCGWRVGVLSGVTVEVLE